jgi:excisionase family DNA binding protein
MEFMTRAGAGPGSTGPSGGEGAMIPAWLSPDEVARLLELNRHTVYRLLRDGQLPGSRIGGRWFVSVEALAARIRGTATT